MRMSPKAAALAGALGAALAASAALAEPPAPPPEEALALLGTLATEPELRGRGDGCDLYDRDDYAGREYARRRIALKRAVAERDGGDGGIVDAWLGRRSQAVASFDMDHAVSLVEASDSGLCGPARRGEREAFAMDLDNLVLTDPSFNRGRALKSGADAAGWLDRGLDQLAGPEGGCLFARVTVATKARWRLSVDLRERQALERLLSLCPAPGGGP